MTKFQLTVRIAFVSRLWGPIFAQFPIFVERLLKPACTMKLFVRNISGTHAGLTETTSMFTWAQITLFEALFN